MRSISEYSYELLPGSNGETEQNSYVIQGPMKSAGYACRAGRGDPVFYTEYSETKWVWSGGEFVSFFSLEADVIASVGQLLREHYFGWFLQVINF